MAENERFDIGKFFRGFAFWKGPVFGKLMQQVLLILAVLALLGGIWYKVFGQRTEHTTQQAQQITNIEEKDKGFRVLGLELFGWRN